MLLRTIARYLLPSVGALRWGLALLVLTTVLSGCADDSPPEAAKPTRIRPTSAASTSNPTPTPRPAAARPTATAGQPARADWTVLVYLDGDNDLEPDAIGDYAEMASVGSSDRVNIVIQLDRISSSEDWDNSSHGDWDDVKRFRVERGKRPTKSNQLADLGELNMGDPRTLEDFVVWGLTTYPAQHYALIFWDHGASWPGVASDDSSDGDMLTLPELAGALADARQKTGVDKLDLIGFDACLMGQIDVLHTIAPFGRIAVGSADLEPGEGWAWNSWLGDLVRDPKKDAAAIAPSIIKSFKAFYKQEGDSSVTLAAFELDKIDDLTIRLDALAGAMIDNMAGSYAAIGQARAYAAEYAGGDKDISAIDLGYFAQSLVEGDAGGDIAKAAGALSQAIKAARIVETHGADHPKTSGISVYFPWKKKNYDSSYVDSSSLTHDTRWDQFLKAFYSAGRNHSSRSSTTKPKLNTLVASAAAPLDLHASISGSDTAYVYYFVGAVAPSNPNALQLLTLDYIYPPGATLDGDIPSWKDGDAVRLTWESSSWYLGNGSTVIPVSLAPLDYGSSTYSVEGTYTAKKTGKRIPVSVEFAIAQGRGTLQHIWAFDSGGGDNPRPRELKPRAGDTFTPDLQTYSLKDDDLEASAAPGQPIVFGADPLVAFEGPAPNGDYVIGLLVENIAGDISDQYADITVDNPHTTVPPAAPAPAPTPPSGGAADTLAYQDGQLGFQVDYPQAWQPFHPGDDKVVFYNPEEEVGAYLSVDVFALEGTPSAANKAILRDLLDVDRDAAGFAPRTELAGARVAGRAGQRVEYVYQDRDGTPLHVIGVAVSDKQAGATYLITFETPEATFAANSATFEQLLGSFTIS